MSGRGRGRGRARSQGRHAPMHGQLVPAARPSSTLPTTPMGRLSDAPGPAILHIEGVPVHVKEADLHESLLKGGVSGYVRVQLICPPMQHVGMVNATFETRQDAERAIPRLQEMFQYNHDHNDWVPTSLQIKMRTNLLPMALRLMQVKALDNAAKDLIGDAADDADVDADIIDSPRFAQKATAEVAAEAPRRRVTIIPGRTDGGGATTTSKRAIQQEALPPRPSTAGVSSHVLAASRPQQADAAPESDHPASTSHPNGPSNAQFAPQESELFSQPSTVSIGGQEAALAPDALCPSSDAAQHAQPAADVEPKPTRRVVLGSNKSSPQEVQAAKPSSRAGSLERVSDRSPDRRMRRSGERDPRDGQDKRRRGVSADARGADGERRAERARQPEPEMADIDRDRSMDRRHRERDRAGRDGKDRLDHHADKAHRDLKDQARGRDSPERSRSRREGPSDGDREEAQGRSSSRVPSKRSQAAKADEEGLRNGAHAADDRHRSADQSGDLKLGGDRRPDSILERSEQSDRDDPRRVRDAQHDSSKRPKHKEHARPSGECTNEPPKARQRGHELDQGRRDVPASLTGRKRPRDEEPEPKSAKVVLPSNAPRSSKNDHRDPSSPNRQTKDVVCNGTAILDAKNQPAKAAVESGPQHIGRQNEERAVQGASANGACDPDTTAALLRQSLEFQRRFGGSVEKPKSGYTSPGRQNVATSRNQMPHAMGGRGSDVRQAGVASTAAADVVAHLASLSDDQALQVLTGHLTKSTHHQNGGPAAGGSLVQRGSPSTIDAAEGRSGKDGTKQPHSAGRGGRRVVWMGAMGRAPHDTHAPTITLPTFDPRPNSPAVASEGAMPSAAAIAEETTGQAMQRAKQPGGGGSGAASTAGLRSPAAAPKGMGMMFKGIKGKGAGKPTRPGHGTKPTHSAPSEATSSSSQQGTQNGSGAPANSAGASRLADPGASKRAFASSANEAVFAPQQKRQAQLVSGAREMSLNRFVDEPTQNGGRQHVSPGSSKGQQGMRGGRGMRGAHGVGGGGMGAVPVAGGRGTNIRMQGGNLQRQRSFQRSPSPHQRRFVELFDEMNGACPPVHQGLGNGMMLTAASMDDKAMHQGMLEPQMLPHQRVGQQVMPGRGVGPFSMEERMNGFMPYDQSSPDLPPHLAGQDGDDLHHLGLRSPQGPQPLQAGQGQRQPSMGQRQGGRGQRPNASQHGTSEHAVRHQGNTHYPPGDLSLLPRFLETGILQLTERFNPHLRLEHFNTRVTDAIGRLQTFQMQELLVRLADVDWFGIAFPPPYIVSTIKAMQSKLQQRHQR